MLFPDCSFRFVQEKLNYFPFCHGRVTQNQSTPYVGTLLETYWHRWVRTLLEFGHSGREVKGIAYMNWASMGTNSTLVFSTQRAHLCLWSAVTRWAPVIKLFISLVWASSYFWKSGKDSLTLSVILFLKFEKGKAKKNCGSPYLAMPSSLIFYHSFGWNENEKVARGMCFTTTKEKEGYAALQVVLPLIPYVLLLFLVKKGNGELQNVSSIPGSMSA